MQSEFIESAEIAEDIWIRYPNYAACLILVSNFLNQPTNSHSDLILAQAEKFAINKLSQTTIDQIPEVILWRETFRSFGVKPQDGRSSFEALLRRASKGLPRIDFLTDIYNAMSVKYLVPIGGEDADKYVGPPRLKLAIGSETFDTTAHGEFIEVNPEPGEVIWRDDLGVTCRRWNWRQCVRTRLSTETSNSLFILDGLGEQSRSVMDLVADELIETIQQISPQAVASKRTLYRL